MKIRLSYKIFFGFCTLSLIAIMIGSYGTYSFGVLSERMEESSGFESVLGLVQQTQQAAMDWVAHREELARQSGEGSEKSGPFQTYERLAKQSKEEVASLQKHELGPGQRQHVNELGLALDTFVRGFHDFHLQFERSILLAEQLRTLSGSMLGKALSLNKSVDREIRDLGVQVAALEKNFSDSGSASREGMSRMLELFKRNRTLEAKKNAASVLLAKPLGFQEMAKDFMLYKDEASGSGLIVEMEKLLGIDSASTMGWSMPVLRAYFTKGRQAKLFEAFEADTHEYLQVFRSYYQLSGEMQTTMASMDKARDALQILSRKARQNMNVSFASIQNRSEKTMVIMVGVAVAASIVLAILVMVTILWRIRKIASEIEKAGREMAVGDEGYAGRITVHGHDELASMASSFNGLMDVVEATRSALSTALEQASSDAATARSAEEQARIAQQEAEQARKQGMLHAGEILEGIVEKLSQASRELSGQIRTSSKNCYHQQERIAESSVATRQMNQATQDVAASCSRAANDTDTAMEAGNKGAAVINETMASIFAITPQTAQLKTGLQELNEEVRNIGQIMTVINDIADQTNLLALNAAIEAARAGNAGRGFAVVADEVRKLAEKTMGATKDVGTAINAIQQSTRASVSRMEKAEEAVEKGRDNAEQAGAALEKIVALIGETSRQTQSIASAVEEQSASTEHIMEAMEEISGGAETTASAMQCSEEHLEVLVNMISELEVMLKGFRTQSDEFADNRLPGSGQLALDAA